MFKKVVPILFFIAVLGKSSVAYSAVINAYQVFMQAQRGNHSFFNVLSKHKSAIDLRTRNGYTAYCLAMIAEDENAMSLLKQYGADDEHECVKKIEHARKNKFNEDDFASQKRFKVAPATSSNALLTGLGVVAVGGGVALAAGGGGGGGGSGITTDTKSPVLYPSLFNFQLVLVSKYVCPKTSAASIAPSELTINLNLSASLQASLVAKQLEPLLPFTSI